MKHFYSKPFYSLSYFFLNNKPYTIHCFEPWLLTHGSIVSYKSQFMFISKAHLHYMSHCKPIHEPCSFSLQPKTNFHYNHSFHTWPYVFKYQSFQHCNFILNQVQIIIPNPFYFLGTLQIPFSLHIHITYNFHYSITIILN